MYLVVSAEDLRLYLNDSFSRSQVLLNANTVLMLVLLICHKKPPKSRSQGQKQCSSIQEHDDYKPSHNYKQYNYVHYNYMQLPLNSYNSVLHY